jgi:hypothetical protein
MAQLVAKLKRDLHTLSLGSSNRAATIIALHQHTQALHVTTIKDMAIRKEAIEAKWIQISGKPNKDFLAKPRASRKRIGNMTIDNVKDQPDLPRMDDINTILHNFVEYYSKLYEHKKVYPVALDRLIKNLTLMLDMEEVEELDKPIMDKEMLAALINTPKGKSPGMDRLPYKCFKEVPKEAAVALTGINNLVPKLNAQPAFQCSLRKRTCTPHTSSSLYLCSIPTIK